MFGDRETRTAPKLITPARVSDGRFRFDAELHEYFDLETGDIIPHITGLLEAAGEIDPTWYTEDSSERGTAVHKLTADYDLGALELAGCVSRYRAYLLAHVDAMKLVGPTGPEWDMIEQPHVNKRLRFGGRPDRVGRMWKAVSVNEVKSGAVDKSHRIQTALQAILVAEEFHLPAESIKRYAEYLTPGGRGVVLEHDKVIDFAKAREILRRFAS